MKCNVGFEVLNASKPLGEFDVAMVSSFIILGDGTNYFVEKWQLEQMNLLPIR